MNTVVYTCIIHFSGHGITATLTQIVRVAFEGGNTSIGRLAVARVARHGAVLFRGAAHWIATCNSKTVLQQIATGKRINSLCKRHNYWRKGEQRIFNTTRVQQRNATTSDRYDARLRTRAPSWWGHCALSAACSTDVARSVDPSSCASAPAAGACTTLYTSQVFEISHRYAIVHY